DLLGCKGFRWSKNHVPGVVNNDIETARLIENLPDRPVGGFLRAHVQFDCTKVNAVLSGKLASGFNLVRVASAGLAHARVRPMSCRCQTTRRQSAKSTRSSRD